MSTTRPFTMLAALIFMIMALVHAYRIVTHFQIIIGNHAVPDWASWVGLLIAGTMSFMLIREAKR